MALLLQAVVADGVGGVQGFFDIAGLQPVQAFLRLESPDAGQAVGLQLLAHQQAIVAFHALATLARGLDLGRDAEQGLHMVADFVGDHVGLGEVAGGRETLLHFAEEAHVQVDLLVGRAIERADRRRGEAAGRVDLAAEQDQVGVFVLAAGLGEDGLPGVFGVAQHGPYEFRLLVVGRRRLAGARADRCGLFLAHLPGQLAEDLQRVLAGDPANPDNQQDRADAQAFATAEAHAATALATGIDHIVATPAFSPLHECSPELGNMRTKISSPRGALSDS
ncbi:hypothetical protein D3C80_927910 [compost metagenome]